MKARRSLNALLWGVLLLLVLPWVLFYVAVTAFMMLVFLPQAMNAAAGMARTVGWLEQWMPQALTALWFTVSLTIAFFTAWNSRWHLMNYFRIYATASYQPALLFRPKLARPGALPPRAS
jgi:hypothetical protein